MRNHNILFNEVWKQPKSQKCFVLFYSLLKYFFFSLLLTFLSSLYRAFQETRARELPWFEHFSIKYTVCNVCFMQRLHYTHHYHTDDFCYIKHMLHIFVNDSKYQALQINYKILLTFQTIAFERTDCSNCFGQSSYNLVRRRWVP